MNGTDTPRGMQHCCARGGGGAPASKRCKVEQPVPSGSERAPKRGWAEHHPPPPSKKTCLCMRGEAWHGMAA